jgi:hypothetical protein
MDAVIERWIEDDDLSVRNCVRIAPGWNCATHPLHHVQTLYPSRPSNGQSHAHPHYRYIKSHLDGKPFHHHVTHRPTTARLAQSDGEYFL